MEIMEMPMWENQILLTFESNELKHEMIQIDDKQWQTLSNMSFGLHRDSGFNMVSWMNTDFLHDDASLTEPW